MLYGISGTLKTGTLILARIERFELTLRTLEGGQLDFAPEESSANNLEWRGTVDGQHAILQVSVCNDCSTIEIRGK